MRLKPSWKGWMNWYQITCSASLMKMNWRSAMQWNVCLWVQYTFTVVRPSYTAYNLVAHLFQLLMCGTGNYSIAEFKEHHIVCGSTLEFQKVNLPLFIRTRLCGGKSERCGKLPCVVCSSGLRVVLDHCCWLHQGGDESPPPVHHRLFTAATRWLCWTQSQVPDHCCSHLWQSTHCSHMVCHSATTSTRLHSWNFQGSSASPWTYFFFPQLQYSPTSLGDKKGTNLEMCLFSVSTSCAYRTMIQWNTCTSRCWWQSMRETWASASSRINQHVQILISVGSWTDYHL